MMKVEFSDNEMKSLAVLVEYLVDSERNHYCGWVGDAKDKRDTSEGHIYLHAKRIEKLLIK